MRAVVFAPSQDLQSVSAEVTVDRAQGHALVVRAEAEELARLAGLGLRVDVLPDPYRLRLRGGEVDLRDHPLSTLPGGEGGAPLLVALDGPYSKEAVEHMSASGAELVGPMPPFGYLVHADAATAARLEDLPEIVAIAPYRAEWKIGGRVPADGASVRVEVVGFVGKSLDAVERAVRAGSGAILGRHTLRGREVLRAELDRAALDRVAELPQVEWVDAIPDGGFFNNEMRVVMQTERKYLGANQHFYNPVYGVGVYGESEIIAISDSGILASHELFQAPGKIFANYVPNNSCGTLGDPAFGVPPWGHGTALAATAVGDSLGPTSGGYGTANGQDGLAFRGRFIMQDFEDDVGNFDCQPADVVTDLFLRAYGEGARVHNNSWGHNIVYPPSGGLGPDTGSYSSLTWAIDDYLKEDAVRDSVLVFAAGNTGGEWVWNGSWYVRYIRRSLSDEAHAKNALTVGGSRNGDGREVMYLFSSHGPTNDCGNPPCPTVPGRIKPDVLAPAIPVHSANSTGVADTIENFSGTSFAAPAASAAAALVRDYFNQGLYPTQANDPVLEDDPSSALVKAMLVNATVFLSDSSAYAGNALEGLPANAYPNYTQGYGRPALDNVLEPAGYTQLKVYENATTELATLEQWSVSPKLKDVWQADCNTLRVTLAWTDEPMTLGSGQALVNDLDLEVVWNGSTYHGNEGLVGTGSTVWDRLNNVEDVRVNIGKSGKKHVKPQITVYGANVQTSERQPFAVVVTYGACFDHTPCDEIGGCYAGPGDIVPGSTPPPGCPGQDYSDDECIDCGEAPFPSCDPPGCNGAECVIVPKPVDRL